VTTRTTTSTDGPVLYVEADDILISAERGDVEALVTLSIPVSMLRALRAALNHPQLIALLEEPVEPASPPVA
jgi:hypothetical protein